MSAPAPWTSHVKAITGKGMWIWQWGSTDAGNAATVVQQAVSAGLHQLWVRVGDSMNGFYGADELDALVPVAHAHGVAVIAWGFPYLWDPAGDAGWTAQILGWRSPGGQQVDGYSADIEKASEGVMLSAERAAVYLELVRQSAGSRLVVATVYPPTDANWDGGYPYQAMAPYVDAFAPMVYWECTDPGTDAALDIARLSTLRPVHVIGQAFNFGSVGGRSVSPSRAEIAEFLNVGHRAGALGGSFWVWQEATPDEWAAVSHFSWNARGPVPKPRRPTADDVSILTAVIRGPRRRPARTLATCQRSVNVRSKGHSDIADSQSVISPQAKPPTRPSPPKHPEPAGRPGPVGVAPSRTPFVPRAPS